MTAFCLLSEPQAYVAHDYDFITNAAMREHWLSVFSRQCDQALVHAATQYGRVATRQIKTAQQQLTEQIAKLRENPASLPSGKLNVIELCRLRDRILRANRIGDPYGYVKNRENDSAMKLYMRLVRELHLRKGPERWEHLIRGIFAGNVFDVGAEATMHLASQGVDFAAEVENLKPRPWLVDDYDRLARDLPDHPPTRWGKAIFFIDNAGSDFILGVMPLARELSLYGTKVVLAANELPCLNDMTINDTIGVLERLMAMDADLQALVEAGMIEVVSTGNDMALLDLADVSDELNAAAADADLVIVEGMGRTIESNYNAKFKVDTLKLAMLKDSTVAQTLGGEVYDCVCKYEPV